MTPAGQAYGLYSSLLKERIIFCICPIDDALDYLIIAQLLYLDSKNHDDIYLYINSNGGSVSAGLAIIDTMNTIHSDVCTVGTGICASMASMLLMSGAANKRYLLPHYTVMIHQPLGNM